MPYPEASSVALLVSAESPLRLNALVRTLARGTGGAVRSMFRTSRGVFGVIKHQIKGTANQMVVCQVDPGQTVYCEAGEFLWKTGNVSIETRLTTPETEEANKEKSGFQKFVSGAKEV